MTTNASTAVQDRKSAKQAAPIITRVLASVSFLTGVACTGLSILCVFLFTGLAFGVFLTVGFGQPGGPDPSQRSALWWVVPVGAGSLIALAGAILAAITSIVTGIIAFLTTRRVVGTIWRNMALLGFFFVALPFVGLASIILLFIVEILIAKFNSMVGA